jgi:putative two-component system response regulator
MSIPPIRIRGKQPSILIVDDTAANLQVLSEGLQKRGYRTRPVPTGKLAVQAALSQSPDLILLDISMPEMDGYEVCERIKANENLRAVPIIFISAHNGTDDIVKAFAAGGVDYVTKPFQFEEVEARVATHLTLRAAHFELERYNLHLQDLVKEQTHDLRESHLATIFAFAKLAEQRDQVTGAHLLRTQRFCRALACHLAEKGLFNIDDYFMENLFHTCPLHDIGKVGIPDAILLKQGPLGPEEFEVMKQHAVLGAETLKAVLARNANNIMIQVSVEVARSHHERWDGSGYPDGLNGEAIPLAARIMTIADQYDALRSARPYKEAFSHERACAILLEGDQRTRPGHFDPRILEAFRSLAGEFAAIYQDLGDDEAAE